MGYDVLGWDFTYWWRAGFAVTQGVSPYRIIRETGPMPYSGNFLYPMPAAVVGVPFTVFEVHTGAAVFVGIGFAVAAFALLSLATWRVAALATAPAIAVLGNGQWAPLLLGAAILPGFGWLLCVKPTIGAALFLWRPRWSIVLGGAAACLLALLVLPTWPLEYLDNARSSTTASEYVPPILMVSGAGLPLLLALLRWRRPEGRLLAAMSIVPQNTFFYDQLPLMLVPQSMSGLLLYGMWSNLVRFSAYVIEPKWAYATTAERSHSWEPFILFGLYLPCLVMVLMRPNDGPVPAWADRLAARLRSLTPLMARGTPRDQRHPERMPS